MRWFNISGGLDVFGLHMEGNGLHFGGGGLGEKSSISWWWWWGFWGKKKGCSAVSEVCLLRQEAADDRKMRESLCFRRFSILERGFLNVEGGGVCIMCVCERMYVGI